MLQVANLHDDTRHEGDIAIEKLVMTEDDLRITILASQNEIKHISPCFKV